MLLLAAALALPDPLAPFDFWVNRCWRAPLSDTLAESYCVTRTPKEVRLHHEYLRGATRIGEDDTRCRWDGILERISCRLVLRPGLPTIAFLAQGTAEGVALEGETWLRGDNAFTRVTEGRQRMFTRVD